MKIIRKNYRKLQERVLAPLCARAAWSSALYYGLFSERFRREAQAVLLARRQHASGSSESYARVARLRRGVHRLEKGLSMPNPKPVFARDYIGGVVSDYVGELGAARMDADSLRWCREVLELFFRRVTTPDAEIDGARALFSAAPSGAKGVAAGAGSSVPYARRDAVASSVGYEEFFALCRRRRSVRQFLPRAVDRALVDRAILAALQAPSACNRQPFEFRCYDEAGRRSRLATLPPGASGFSADVPLVVAVIGDVSAYAEERDRHLIYIDGSLAAMQFMLALETLGLSSCSVNWPDIAEKDEELARELALPPYQRCVMFIMVGHADPDGMIPFSQKKSLDAARSYNQ